MDVHAIVQGAIPLLTLLALKVVGDCGPVLSRLVDLLGA